jgi:hypothetical protein
VEAALLDVLAAHLKTLTPVGPSDKKLEGALKWAKVTLPKPGRENTDATRCPMPNCQVAQYSLYHLGSRFTAQICNHNNDKHAYAGQLNSVTHRKSLLVLHDRILGPINRPRR